MNKLMIDTVILKNYMDFFGFGKYEADYWLVGMEHGEGKSPLHDRLVAWCNIGCPPIADFYQYSSQIESERCWLGTEARVQRTYGPMIRLLMSAIELETSLEKVRHYQGTRFGRKNGDALITELLPLSNRTVNEWRYSSIDIDYLRSRKEYEDYIVPYRVDIFKRRIAEQRPKNVVFFGWSWRDRWEDIVGVPFTIQALQGREIGHAMSGTTRFLLCHHPNSRGVTSAYFEEAGSLISKAI